MKPRLLLAIVLARCPRNSAGHVCAIMNFAVGFEEAGWEVFVVEALTEKELSFSDGGGGKSDQELFWRRTTEEFGFAGRECLLIEGESADRAAMEAFAAQADLFLNYSGQFHRLDLLPPRLRKAYLDVDPAFTQIWAEAYGSNMNFDGHDAFLTVGLNFQSRRLRAPLVGKNWLPVLTPVPADLWASRAGRATGEPDAREAWTTVAHWYGYGDVMWEGGEYAGKRAGLLELQGLPPLAKPSKFAIASDLEPEWGDYEEFVQSGWSFFPSAEVCRSVDHYLRFLATSRGEIGIAKKGYVVARCGWVSDRSLVYLSLGRPVLLQDTGWTDCMDGGAGMLPFSGPEDAADAIRRIEADYPMHSAAAAALARSEFSPQKVVGEIAAACGL